MGKKKFVSHKAYKHDALESEWRVHCLNLLRDCQAKKQRSSQVVLSLLLLTMLLGGVNVIRSYGNN